MYMAYEHFYLKMKNVTNPIFIYMNLKNCLTVFLYKDVAPVHI